MDKQRFERADFPGGEAVAKSAVEGDSRL